MNIKIGKFKWGNECFWCYKNEFGICSVDLRKGQLDVRELISLYPLLLPASSTFTRCHPPLHEFADLNHLTQGDKEKVLHFKRFLITYLHEVRSVAGANGFREDVDTALLKLYAETGHDSLLDLLAPDNACLLADCAPWLEKHHKWVLAFGCLLLAVKQEILSGFDLKKKTLVEKLVKCTKNEVLWMVNVKNQSAWMKSS